MYLYSPGGATILLYYTEICCCCVAGYSHWYCREFRIRRSL